LKVLVTGANGQVGSELIQQGVKLGLQMLAASHDEFDITRQHLVNSYISEKQPDIVINAAAYTAVDKAESEAELAYAVNGDGAAYLAQACADNKIPMMHLSTDYVFDGSKIGAYLETDNPNPQCIYGKSKLAGDLAIESILQDYIILRVSWVFGSNGNNFVKTMLRLGKERELLRVVADQHGGPTWAGAIADTLLNIVIRWRDGEDIPWGTYNYCGQPTTWRDFAEVIFERAIALGIVEKAPKIEAITTDEYLTPARRPLNSVLDCQKIGSKLNINRPDWYAGLNKVLSDWKV
jgi:dTDP-4-dehydrorhamnose reductase